MLLIIRNELLDPATDRSGLTIPEAQREWTDEEIEEALGSALIELDRKLTNWHPGSRVVSVDGSYDAGANVDDLPAAIGAFDPIFKVEDISDTSRPNLIPYVTPHEIERYAVSRVFGAPPPWVSYHHTLIDNGVARGIQIRPQPLGALAIRVYYIAPPVLPGVGEDIPLTAQWLDLIGLKAACILLARKNAAAEQQLLRLNGLMDDFQKATRNRQPTRIRRTRRGQS